MAGIGPPPSDQQVERALAERGRALVATAVAETSAPLGLRERIERDREQARPVARRRRLGLGLAGSLTAVAAAAAAAIVISVGGTSAPGVLATVQLAGRGPALPAPRPDATHPALLKAQIDGLPFPDWNAKFKWRASGARRDTIESRDATTVYYDAPGGVRLAYTILGGTAIKPPDGARTVRLRGTTLHVMNRGSQRIVVWNRARHTCVMSAPSAVPEQRLLALAAWDAGGGVPF
ncbi:MAG: hypothetical protein QOH72_326 [Solirubrobacteraceae bacterium]|jgi:hypothetical protein|nr:hypothetical protein [Solirubrobacteraceae bacterium]